MERRIAALEKRVQASGCRTCRDWSPQAVIVRGDEPAPPTHCPDCDRHVRWVIQITRVPGGIPAPMDDTDTSRGFDHT